MFTRKHDDDAGEPAQPTARTHPPVRACPVCASSSLTETTGAALPIYRDRGFGAQQLGYVGVTIVTCDSCGRLDLFAPDPSVYQGKLPSGPQQAGGSGGSA